MANKKTKQQKFIDRELKKLNPNFKLWTEKEYSTNPNAIKLMDILSVSDNYEKAFEYPDISFNIFLHEITNTPLEMSECYLNPNNEHTYTAQFFGLTNLTLIEKLSNNIYYEAISAEKGYQYYQTTEHEYSIEYKEHANSLRIPWLFKYRKLWIDYCNNVENYQAFFTKLLKQKNITSDKEQKLFIKTLSLVYSAPFSNGLERGFCPETDFIHYLNNYGLNQKNKAKADFLYQMGFPNVTKGLAKEIVENTNLQTFPPTF